MGGGPGTSLEEVEWADVKVDGAGACGSLSQRKASTEHTGTRWHCLLTVASHVSDVCFWTESLLLGNSSDP